MTGILLAIFGVWGIFGAAAATADAPVWQIVWLDEFEGASLDESKWVAEESCWGGGNNERQCYTTREDNVEVADGYLRLKAREESFEGRMFPLGKSAGRQFERRTQPYTSGKVKTRGKADWKYGRFSARIKLPAGQGTWPAFWMMPTGDDYGTWPLSGEIDIMEAVNLGTPCADCPGGRENRTSAALHFGERWPDNTYLTKKTAGTPGYDPSQGFHTYTVEWAEGVLQWFVDGEIFLRITEDQWFTASCKTDGSAAAPFDKPFYLMLNYAVGGNLSEKSNGAGFDPASYPSELVIDWVRVEQCAGDLETGKACLTPADWDGEPEGPWETQAR